MIKCCTYQPSSGIDKNLVLRPQPRIMCRQFPNCTLQWCPAVIIINYGIGFDLPASQKFPYLMLVPPLHKIVERRADPRVCLASNTTFSRFVIWNISYRFIVPHMKSMGLSCETGFVGVEYMVLGMKGCKYFVAMRLLNWLDFEIVDWVGKLRCRVDVILSLT
jgi:hypothetical protein